MTEEVSELQNKRADNIIWNSAGDYSFTPDFKAFDPDGNAELYWNLIIGSVRRHFDYPEIEKLLYGVQQYEESGLYEGIIWLAAESAVFRKEVPFRPILEVLRKKYAQSYISETKLILQPLSGFDSFRLLESISLAYWKNVIGTEQQLPEYDLALIRNIPVSGDPSTAELAAHIRKLLNKWFLITAEEKKKAGNKPKLPGLRKTILKRSGKKKQGKYIPFGRGIAFHPENVYGGTSVDQGELNELTTKLSDAELREFMEAKFGRSLHSPVKTAELEKTICKGNHALCHILFTDGKRIGNLAVRNGFEALSRQREAAQIERNREFYRQNRARNTLAVSRLSGNIRNSVLLHLQSSPVKADSGRFEPTAAWRASALDDEKVFIRQENDNQGNICVDILLDASTSQKFRQEIISSQGYIIAESLTRCGIPCRVMSFCSMTGYTVVRVFRDYGKPADNAKIFEYVSNGCNRDGLAIRTVARFISEAPYEHRILIILSDVKPNDVVRIRKNGSSDGISYDSAAGLEDTALEVRRARAEGISVICIFTGEDEDLPSAKLVYGRDFVRIRSFDMLADTVGMLIRNQIKNL
ncbi:MAG: hypothetical protein Q4F31_05145 [Eubacteriales bacterium]|nr:hypothetical protein [Eubacteriales bacterium]